jgi:hypothetical protein
LRCDRCALGYGNLELNCVACNCDLIGSTSPNCDEATGQCPCRSDRYLFIIFRTHIFNNIKKLEIFFQNIADLVFLDSIVKSVWTDTSVSRKKGVNGVNVMRMELKGRNVMK